MLFSLLKTFLSFCFFFFFCNVERINRDHYPQHPNQRQALLTFWQSSLNQPTFCIHCCLCSVAMSNYLQPHGLQNAKLPCSSLSPWVCSNSCLLSRWGHPTISSAFVPFSSCLQACPASGSFPVSQFFTSGGQSIGVSPSASSVPVNIRAWLPFRFTGSISLLHRWFLLSKGFSRVFSSTTVWKHPLFSLFLTWIQGSKQGKCNCTHLVDEVLFHTKQIWLWKKLQKDTCIFHF